MVTKFKRYGELTLLVMEVINCDLVVLKVYSVCVDPKLHYRKETARTENLIWRGVKSQLK